MTTTDDPKVTLCSWISRHQRAQLERLAAEGDRSLAAEVRRAVAAPGCRGRRGQRAELYSARQTGRADVCSYSTPGPLAADKLDPSLIAAIDAARALAASCRPRRSHQ
jgi:hypothetical protein